jgi:SAM-dependent methyltransferase
VTAFDALKERQSAAWGAAPFERVAEQAGAIHDHLVRELAPQPGERWLDVGTGTGVIAVRAARAGAAVTAIDLAPALVETARRLAEEEGLSIRFEVGDAERLEFGDGSFDVVSSSFAAIFAPDHGAVARELARVTRPGGRIGLTTWDPEGGIGDFFRIIARFQPPLPDGAGNPLDWGREAHVAALLGEAFELRYVHGEDPQRGSSPEEIWRLFLTSFGPLKVLHDSLGAERREELHDAFVDFYAAHMRDGRVEAPREYVIVLGTRR